jgi:hypothetical protein
VDIFLRWEDTERAVIENGIETERNAGKPLQKITMDAAGNLSAFTLGLATVTHAHYWSFIFANIMNIKSLNDVITNQKLIKIKNEIDLGKTTCKNMCNDFIVWGGGDPAMKLWENNTFAGTETTECRPAIKARTDALLYYLGTLPYK